MGGPFRAIVGGQARYKWSFAPAAWIRVDNNSTQYFRLDELDDYIVPGQINKFINVDGLTSLTGIFSAPPGVSQAAPTVGQIAQVWTYNVGASGGPLGPSPGLLLPIGLDQPQHFHRHTNVHLHGHAATHSHSGGGTHNHAHSAVHNHPISTINSFTTTGGIQGVSGTLATLDHIHNANGFGSFADVTGNAAPGNTDLAAIGTTGSSAPGNTDNASPGDSDLENVQHTHP